MHGGVTPSPLGLLKSTSTIEFQQVTPPSSTHFHTPDRVIALFLRRHVYEHNGGEVDERYIMESGDKNVRPKQRIRETSESTSRAGNLIELMGRNFKTGFDEIFPPVEEPIRHEEYRKKMMRQS